MSMKKQHLLDVISESNLPMMERRAIAKLVMTSDPPTDESPTTVEWGVRITTVGHNTLHRSKESAEADVEFWKNRIEPDPDATKFPRALIRRIAATEWEVVQS